MASEPMMGSTLFKLAGLEGNQFRFRVLKVREPVPADNQKLIRLNKWASALWRKDLRCPVYVSSRHDFPAFIVPEGQCPRVGTSFEFRDVPDRLYHVDVTEEVVSISTSEAKRPEMELACRMVERAFTDKLRGLPQLFWKAQWTLFFRVHPGNRSNPDDVVNAFRGLKFGVVFLNQTTPYLAADIQTKYIGRKALSQHSAGDRAGLLSDHLSPDLPVERRATFIRDNGSVKISCRFVGETGKSVRDFRLESLGKSVFEYYRERYPSVAISPDDPVVFVQDKEDGESLPVPASRLFPVFTTDYDALRTCSVRAQMTPQERISEIHGFLRDLGPVSYEGRQVSVSRDYLVHSRTVFLPPVLEFGQGSKLSRDKVGGSLDSLIARWGSMKMPELYRSGPYHNEPIPDVVLLYPESLERGVREGIVRSIDIEVRRQTSQALPLAGQVAYRVGLGQESGSSLLRAASDIGGDAKRKFALVVLWKGLRTGIHADLKEAFGRQPSQCVTEGVVRNIVSQANPRSTSQVRYLSLSVLTEAGVQPWVLADHLHHDVYIGIDVLMGRVGYHFLYDVGGRKVFRESGWAVARAREGEAIKRPELSKRIEAGLRKIHEAHAKMESIVIHRDGRWWPSESMGLAEVISRLKREGVLHEDLRWAVVEIRKSHVPVRLFTSMPSNGGVVLRNPLPGTHLLIDSTRALLTTTGRPGAWDNPGGRTAGTIMLDVAEASSHFDVAKLAEDAYRLTHLNWNSPDIEIAVPVTIRWTDVALRETLRPPDNDEDDREEVSGDQEVLGRAPETAVGEIEP